MAQPIHPIQSSILWGGDIFHPPTKTKNGLVETYGVCSVLVLPTFNPAWRSFSQWLWSHFLWNSALVYIMPSKAGIMFRKVALCNLPLIVTNLVDDTLPNNSTQRLKQGRNIYFLKFPIFYLFNEEIQSG